MTRQLNPNVDNNTGIILRAAGIPTDMYTVLFAIGRMPGWLAHWREMLRSEPVIITRPRQIYVGESMRHYQTIERRP